MDSYASPRGDHYRNINLMSSAGGVAQSQTHLPPDYIAFENFHQNLPPEHESMNFVHNIHGSSPATFASEATGWGDFDSFVSNLCHSFHGSISYALFSSKYMNE